MTGAVELRDYLRQEGWAWYFAGPGFWSPAAALAAGALAASWLNVEELATLGLGLLAATGVMLAVTLTLVTFILSALSVEELQSFIHSRAARAGFGMMLAGVKWSSTVSVWCFAVSAFLAVVPAVARYYFALIVFGVSFSHLRFAVFAAFDFAQMKAAIAALKERAADAERPLGARLDPP
jgi:hypothetical protein